MTSINFKVIGLTRLEIEPAGSGLEPVIFRFHDLPAWEAGVLLIRLPRLVCNNESSGHDIWYCTGDRLGLK